MVIEIGIIGFGWVARDYMLPAIEAHTGVRLRAVVSPDPADFTGLGAGVKTFAAAEEMVRGVHLDAVYVASPNHLHRAHVELAIRAGWHVLCEKPLAASIADARTLVRAVLSRPEIVYRTAYDQRHHPAHRKMRSMIAGGEVGGVTQIRIDYACWLPADWADNNWRIDPERAGGGAVIDLAPHGLDLAEYLTGQRLEELTVLLQYHTHCYGVDDGGVLSGRFDGGALLAHTVGYNRPEALPRRRLEVIGTKGILLAENTMGQTAGGSLSITRADEDEPVTGSVPFADTPPFFNQLDSFVTAILHPTQGLNAASDDLRLAELLDAQLNKKPTPVWH